jgi:hypothetical protein
MRFNLELSRIPECRKQTGNAIGESGSTGRREPQLFKGDKDAHTDHGLWENRQQKTFKITVINERRQRGTKFLGVWHRRRAVEL